MGGVFCASGNLGWRVGKRGPWCCGAMEFALVFSLPRSKKIVVHALRHRAATKDMNMLRNVQSDQCYSRNTKHRTKMRNESGLTNLHSHTNLRYQRGNPNRLNEYLCLFYLPYTDIHILHIEIELPLVCVNVFPTGFLKAPDTTRRWKTTQRRR